MKNLTLVISLLVFFVQMAKSQGTFTANVIKANNGFQFNNVEGLPQLGVSVHSGGTNPGHSGGLVTLGPVNTGGGGGTTNPDPPDPCSQANSNPWFLMNGGFISTAKSTANCLNASLSMYTAPWNGSSFIESAGIDPACNSTALYLNYFCGQDIGLCTNGGLWNGGGKVRVGKFLSAAQHVEIGDPQYGIASNNSPASNIALEMHVNTGKAIKIKTWNGSLSMLEIQNTGLNGSPTIFKVDGNGRTFIGIQKPLSTGPHADAMLAVDGKILAKEIFVNIHNSVWADYVFESNYKLTPLKELEKYVFRHKHLPNVPSAKELTGTDEYNLSLGEMNRIQMEKIEELYLYVFQQQKELDVLKQKIKTLEKQ
jgi:hypothetical protein